MTISRRRRGIAAVLVLLATFSPVASPRSASAGSGLNEWHWGGPGITLSNTSYKYSNMSGFWQAVLNSNACPVAVDGIYGNVTHWYTDSFQYALFGTHNAGTMTPAYLNAFQRAGSPYGPRLVDLFYTDGYGTQHYSYYGGYDSPVRLGWNPFAAQWFFAQRPVAQPWALTSATPNRTIGSVPACS
jgi:hypothetical protein